MKKLSLEKLNLGANDLLQINQLKTILGGGYGECDPFIGPGSPCSSDFDCCEDSICEYFGINSTQNRTCI